MEENATIIHSFCIYHLEIRNVEVFLLVQRYQRQHLRKPKYQNKAFDGYRTYAHTVSNAKLAHAHLMSKFLFTGAIL
jgi:hypothetical protein